MSAMTSNRLTGRQAQVLRAYLEAGTHGAAAARLGISTSSVKQQLAVCAQKLGASCSQDLARAAIDKGVAEIKVFT